jgi:hypothetical protein
MKLLVDLQACQTHGSRKRGIGRYSLALALAMARESRGNELHIALSSCFPDAVREIQESFAGVLPPSHIHVRDASHKVSDAKPENTYRRLADEIIRNELFESLRPDAVHAASLIEGLSDDAITTVDPLASYANAVTLYDLIPL